jgi:Cyclic nucleotide-binding domain
MPSFVVWFALGLVVCLCNSYRQVILSILPSVARGGRALAAQNIVMSWNESTAKIAAPLICAFTLSRASDTTKGTYLLFFGASFAALLVVLAGRKYARIESAREAKRVVQQSTTNSLGTTSARPTTTDSIIATIRRSRPLRTLLLLNFARFATVGATSVLYLSLAKSAGLGANRSGALSWAFGFGGLIAFFVRGVVLGRAKLAGPLLLFALLASAAWAVIGFTTRSAPTIIALVAISGLSGAMYSVIRLTLVQRLTPTGFGLRMSNVFQMTVTTGLASGAMIGWASGTTQRACFASALIFPLICAFAISGVMEIDGSATIPVTEIALLQRTSILQSMAPPAIEALARQCEPRSYPATTNVVVEGDLGTEVFVIVGGEADVYQSDQKIRRMTRDDMFGEIAVLSNGPRTATVRAVTQLDVLRIQQDDFVQVVGLHEQVGLDVQSLWNERS